MATLETRLNALAAAIGADIKSLKAADGTLSSLSTTAKGNIVAAINEIFTMASGAGAINDASTGTGATWSASKIGAELDAHIAALKTELVGGASSALDTFAELATALNNDATFASTIATGLGYRVRFDAAQTLTAPQQAQALANIGGASAASVTTLSGNIGNTDVDLVSAYTTAKS